MNERIQELAEQAGFGIAGNPEYIHAMDYDGMCTDELEKFAELIVRECITLGTNFTNRNYSDDAGERIAKHFGVE